MPDLHPASIRRIEALSLIACEPDAVTLSSEAGVALVITSPREGVFRLRLGSSDGATYPILTFDQQAPGLPLEVVDDETSITIAAGELSLTIRKSPVDFELNW